MSVGLDSVGTMGEISRKTKLILERRPNKRSISSNFKKKKGAQKRKSLANKNSDRREKKTAKRGKRPVTRALTRDEAVNQLECDQKGSGEEKQNAGPHSRRTNIKPSTHATNY